MTKLNEDFKYESTLKQAGVPNVLSCYCDHTNIVQCERGLCYQTAKVCQIVTLLILRNSQQDFRNPNRLFRFDRVQP